MKKILLSMAALCVASGAYAQSLTPANGIINLDVNSGGLSSIEMVGGSYTVNRACPDMAVLRHDGRIIKQVPASNLQSVYTFEGYTSNIPGSGHITFFETAEVEKAMQFGVYTAEIPEGFFMKSDGTPCKALSGEWRINTPYIHYSPASGASLEKFSVMRLTFPAEGEVSFHSDLETAKSLIGLDLSESTPVLDENGKPVLDSNGEPTSSINSLHPLDIKIMGRVVELTFQEVTVPQRLYFDLPAGVFDFTVSSGPMASETPYQNGIAGMAFYVTAPASTAWTIEPLVATYEGGIPAAFTETNTAGKTVKGWFLVKSSEDTKAISMVMAGVPYLVTVNADGSYGERVNGVSGLKAYKVDNHTLIFTTTDTDKIGDPGDLKLPAGTYALYMPKSTVYPMLSEDLYLGRITITAPEVNDYIITPSTEEELDEISKIEVIFEEGAKVEWTRGQYVSLNNEEGTIDYTLLPVAEGNKLIVNIPAAVTAPGKWNFKAGSAGLIVNGTSRNVEATFTIKEAPKTEIQAESTGYDTTLEQTEDEDWGSYTLVTTTTKSETATITVIIPEGYNEMYYQYAGAMGIQTPAYRRTPASDVIAAGWTKGNVLTVDRGTSLNLYGIMFGKDGEVNTEEMHRLMVTVLDGNATNVELVGAENRADVYTITGVKVLSGATSNEIKNLPAGLYIVNGVKILVK